ncbi:nuclease-related domain-containing protein [Aquibacillus rhizosphaerae]|uniref:Nuclease-related domain-containing protein n=1 Tax=Aquibacillus rhizosphaerae TaxID=3051431 RepID=A0ABT7LDE6_9BACI|nr:nuclease-related domain-containing protein [Aquibacillus sp. LR5S19]MDL4842620.1 nuclease-related domain-containing protein [Aquibacillus sp. LR5S19]
MFKFLKKKQPEIKAQEVKPKTKNNKSPTNRTNDELAVVKGQIGEHKIDIQLAQMPKEYRYINDVMIKNAKSKSGYSQIDHVVITPYGIFVIETKNYQGTIYGGKDRKTWLVNGKFKFMNPFYQNYGHIKALLQVAGSKYEDLIISMVSFTKRCTFKIDVELRKIASNHLIVYDIELSEFIERKVNVLRLQHDKVLLTKEEIDKIYQSVLEANITDKAIRLQHNEALKSAPIQTTPKPSSTSKCVVCNKAVSDKVKSFCLSNKRFNGKVYCFDHQK